MAAITGTALAGVATVGTLRETRSLGSDRNEGFTGAIDYLPADARRGHGRVRAAELLPAWASEQARLLAAAQIPLPTRQYAAERVAGFGGDASPIASMRLNGAWASLAEVFEHLVEEGDLHAPIANDRMAPDRVLLTVARERHSGFVDSYLPGELEYLLATLEGTDSSGRDALYTVPTDVDPAPNGFLAMLNRYAIAQGYQIAGEFLASVEFARYVGKPSERQGLMPGKVVATAGLRLSANRVAA